MTEHQQVGQSVEDIAARNLGSVLLVGGTIAVVIGAILLATGPTIGLLVLMAGIASCALGLEAAVLRPPLRHLVPIASPTPAASEPVEQEPEVPLHEGQDPQDQ